MEKDFESEKLENENIEGAHVSVQDFAKKLGLEIVFEGKGDLHFTTFNVNRPGLQLAGYFDYFGENRVQVVGNAEMCYYEAKPLSDKIMIMNMILSNPLPCFIVCRNLPICDTFLESFKSHNVPLLRSSKETTALINNLIMYLNEELAERTTVHGVLLDVSGVGVLLTGKSGIGKSETALELVKRGHRLVADDAVIIKKVQNNLIGRSPEIIKHFMEIRGIGILDVKRIYGIGAVSEAKTINLVVEMEHWDNKKQYDRLGGNQLFEEILGIYVPKMVIPITPGRNLPIIIEAAATTHTLKKSGYDAAQVLIEKSMGKNENR
ncbi:MAG: HPr(Ser) kinase/phosphatase [Clostridia bacterium]